MPILEVLKSKNLINIVAVVTRYFGGVKLGTGGLVRAYSGITAETLSKAGTAEKTLCNVLLVKTDYENYSALLNFLKAKKLTLISSEFNEKAQIKTAVPADTAEIALKEITDYLHGRVEIIEAEKGFFPSNR